jgi:hypothetical protein
MAERSLRGSRLTLSSNTISPGKVRLDLRKKGKSYAIHK